MIITTHTQLVDYLVNTWGLNRGVAKVGCNELLREDDTDRLMRSDDEYQITGTEIQKSRDGTMEFEVHTVCIDTDKFGPNEGTINFINEMISIQNGVICCDGEPVADLNGDYLP